MRAFLAWLVISAVAWGAAAWGLHAHFAARPSLVLVVVDTSLAMDAVWSRVPGVLDRLDDAPYTDFELYSPRGPIHGPSAVLKLGQTTAYGPRDLSGLAGFPDTASRRVLVTNAPEAELSDLSGWEILRP